ncbi:MAG TPA: diacylglycerol kinase family protein [Candidatus Nanoarchaeia archaeon]|nr:diacylglycerol kinase family protein [Candidatus Nanoarchaeia archaeon]
MIRLFKSFAYAFRGLGKIFREEQNLQAHSLVAIMVIALGFIFKIQSWQWCAILICVALVILMETANSAIERLADALKPRIHESVMAAKDIMAAAVLIAALLAVAVGLIIFIPYFALI